MAIKPTDYVINITDLYTPDARGYPWPPLFWQNFQKKMSSKVNWNGRRADSDPVLTLMKEYFREIDAEIKYNKDMELIIKFKDETDFLVFKLKWS